MKRTKPFSFYWKHYHGKNWLLAVLSIGVVIAGSLFLWVATINIPDFHSFEERKILKSTKIYDRTGEIALYDVNDDVKRTIIPFEDMGINIKNATVAIEDSEFYQHAGIRPKAILRAIFANIFKGRSEGGSTITQQIVKNTLLTTDKTITRKLKEWVLALKIEQVMSKEEILAIYLNESPYGGSMYGIEEASKTYFNKEPKDITIAEAAYLAAIPQAPTYYSPYGNNRANLDNRKNLVLGRMKELGFLTPEEYDVAHAEVITFNPQEPVGIKAPHFVFFIKQYLEQKYGKDMVEQDGLKVITTLNYELQQKAEEIVKQKALENEKNFGGSNAGLVALDPKTGQILVMVGSRDYFDKDIDGNFNVALAKRQPGSSFKPFVYATAFNKGYLPETVVFDVATEFSGTCDAYGNPLPGSRADSCYSPMDFDNKFRGPMSLRNALAQSINIPAVKMLYLVGIDNAIQTAEKMGITTLTDSARYGLTLVLGGGEVTLLDMASAYGGFATGGINHPDTGILRVEDSNGKVLEEFKDSEETVLPKNTALLVNDILSDNVARVPTFGATALAIPGRQVAVKTGTTNNYKDAWIMSYTPSLVVGGWVGNNDNSPMKKVSLVPTASSLWKPFMVEALKTVPDEVFEKPISEADDESIKPSIRGKWLGGESYFIDTISGKLATEFTPKETREERVITDVHSILYWITKDDPRGARPSDPTNDPQFIRWETGIQNWWAGHQGEYPVVGAGSKPTMTDDIHTPANAPTITITQPIADTPYPKNNPITISTQATGRFPLQKIDVFINGVLIGSTKNAPFTYTFTPSDVDGIQDQNELKVIGYDSVYNIGESAIQFSIQ